MTVRSILVNVAAAIVVPFLLQSICLVVAGELGPMPWDSSLGPHVVNAIIGFAFLVRALRVYAIAAGVVYLPAMVALLVGFSLAWGSR